MACVPAPACKAALAEASARWPARRRTSDGICPSAAHSQQNPKSDHELGNAFDLSHDPANGVDCAVLSRYVMYDPRLKYVIFNREIFNPSVSPHWRKYTGTNPHTSHMHVSIKADKRNETYTWFDVDDPEPVPVPPTEEEDMFVNFLNTPEGDGAWLLFSDGSIQTAGNAAYFGGVNYDPNSSPPGADYRPAGFEATEIRRRADGLYGYTIKSTTGDYTFPSNGAGAPLPGVYPPQFVHVDWQAINDAIPVALNALDDLVGEIHHAQR